MGRRQGARRAHPAPFYAPADLVLSRRYQMVRDVTDEQRSRRPIFNATLWAAASWLFFRVARSTRPAPFFILLAFGSLAAVIKWCGMGASLAP